MSREYIVQISSHFEADVEGSDCVSHGSRKTRIGGSSLTVCPLPNAYESFLFEGGVAV